MNGLREVTLSVLVDEVSWNISPVAMTVTLMTYPTIGPFRSSGGGGSHVKTTERGSVGIATKFPGELLGAVNKQRFVIAN